MKSRRAQILGIIHLFTLGVEAPFGDAPLLVVRIVPSLINLAVLSPTDSKS